MNDAEAGGDASTSKNAPTINNVSGPTSNSASGTSNSHDTEQSFKALCSQSNLQQNWDTCKSHCSRYGCCFSRENSCYQKNTLECDEYYICEEFYSDEEEEYDARTSVVDKNDPAINSGLASNSGSSISNANKIEHAFKDLCSESNLLQNWDTCEDHCFQFECCFTSENSCYQQKKLECDEYYICEEFFIADEEAEDEAEAEADAALANENYGSGSSVIVSSDTDSLEAMQYRCSASHLEKHLLECGEWCVTYECCFYDSNSCYLANKQQCDDHDICKSVLDLGGNSAGTASSSTSGAGISNSPSLPMANNAQTIDEGLDATELQILERACGINQLRVNDSECKMLCRGSECCFSQYSHCNGMETFCNDHAICSRMFD